MGHYVTGLRGAKGVPDPVLVLVEVLFVDDQRQVRGAHARLLHPRVVHIATQQAVFLAHLQLIQVGVVKIDGQPRPRLPIQVRKQPAHRVTPELPVHTQRRAARRSARQQVVVRQAVRMRAPHLQRRRQQHQDRQ